MYSQNVVLNGRLSEVQWREFLSRCVADLGMTKAGEPAIWRYPVDGKGGNGMTACQPITESFIVADTWPDHDGAYLHISSCRPFAITRLFRAVEEYGLTVKDAGLREILAL
jgi:S-adenosylmethionine/arginine decarboxylase-like enzyme